MIGLGSDKNRPSVKKTGDSAFIFHSNLYERAILLFSIYRKWPLNGKTTPAPKNVSQNDASESQ